MHVGSKDTGTGYILIQGKAMSLKVISSKERPASKVFFN